VVAARSVNRVDDVRQKEILENAGNSRMSGQDGRVRGVEGRMKVLLAGVLASCVAHADAYTPDWSRVVREHPQTYAGCSGSRAGDECVGWVETESRSWTGVCAADVEAHGALACVPRLEETAIEKCDERARLAGAPSGFVGIEVYVHKDGRRDYIAGFVSHLGEEHVKCLLAAYRFMDRHRVLPSNAAVSYGLGHRFRQ
jgi:hypothetical protein